MLAGVRACRSTSTVLRAGQPALALDDGDAAALDQAGEPLEEPGDDAVLVGVDAGHVDALERGAARRTARTRGRSRRPRRRAAAPWSGCSRRAGRCRRACPSRPGRRAGRAGRRAARRRSRREPAPRMSTSKSAALRHCRSCSGRSSRRDVAPSLHPCRLSTPAVPTGRAATGHTGAHGVSATASAAASRARMRRPVGRRGPAPAPPRVRAADAADEQHLREFVATRRGVEGFVEPRTAVSDVTLLLVAHDGEWTRRRVPSVRVGAHVLQQAPGAVVRRRGGRHPAADARLQPPQEAAGRLLADSGQPVAQPGERA